jgi:hypothetical protein
MAALEGLRVVAADTHLTEAHGLWTERAPSKYKDRVRRNLHATFWFEKNNLATLYPKPLDTVAEKMSTLSPEVQRKVPGENAQKLYRP